MKFLPFSILLWCFISTLQADSPAEKPYSDDFSAHPPSATVVPGIGLLLPPTVSASFTRITLSSLAVWSEGLMTATGIDCKVLHASREPVVLKTSDGWDITFKPAPSLSLSLPLIVPSSSAGLIFSHVLPLPIDIYVDGHSEKSLTDSTYRFGELEPVAGIGYSPPLDNSTTIAVSQLADGSYAHQYGQKVEILSLTQNNMILECSKTNLDGNSTIHWREVYRFETGHPVLVLIERPTIIPAKKQEMTWGNDNSDVK